MSGGIGPLPPPPRITMTRAGVTYHFVSSFTGISPRVSCKPLRVKTLVIAVLLATYRLFTTALHTVMNSPLRYRQLVDYEQVS